MMFRVMQKIPTYASAIVEADSASDARIKCAADDVEWDYDTDYDAAVFLGVETIGFVPAAVPEHNRYNYVDSRNYRG